jgi:D-alanyl-D-alanine carboxypeptidase
MKLARLSTNLTLTFASVLTAISLFGITIFKKDRLQPISQNEVLALVKKKIIVTPVLIQQNEPLVLTAQSVYAVDLNSGEVLYQKNPDQPSLPASTAKIVTALVSLDYYPLDHVIEVKSNNIEGQKMGLLVGENITVDSLLKGLLIYSANDAAKVLADNYPGGRDLFISKMNLKAQEVGLQDSYFENPVGLDGTGQFTTAKDLVKVSEYAIKNPYIATIVSTKKITVISVDGKIVHDMENINKLLGNVDGVLGVKTGWTENAHENLVTYVERDNKKVMIALLGSEDRFGETEKLINWIFDNFIWEAKEVVG